jgi:hypothetical protein
MGLDEADPQKPGYHVVNAIEVATCLAILYTSVRIGSLVASQKSELQQPIP